MIIAQKVLQDNSYWAHTENIVIALLADEREELRRMGVLRIMKGRREFDVSNHPRKYNPPKVDFKAKNYFDMVDWNSEPCTEPPLTMEYSAEEIFECIGSPLTLPNYPNHTQAVERMVRVVCEVASKRVGYLARHRQILQKLESRRKVPKFNTKMDDAVY